MHKKNQFFFALFLAYLFSLCYFLFQNDLYILYAHYPLEDKLIHFGAFFIGQLLLLSSGTLKPFLRWIFYSLFLLLPMIAEIIQHRLPHRISDFSDMIAGYFGIIVSLILWYLIKKIIKTFFFKER